MNGQFKPNAVVEDRMLKGVSRSFALTIPQLPEVLCRTVTTAYLMCRIVDTIEDEEGVSIALKRRLFAQFMDVVDGNGSPEKFSAELYPLLGRFTTTEEKELVRNTPIVIQAFRSYSSGEQAAIQRCLESMASGMLLFQQLKSPYGLESFVHMNTYCYHVAGVVGEMLAELFCAYSLEIDRYRNDLLTYAKSFGQGLQMTNILKDLWEDRRRGVCWLPKEVFAETGFDLRDLVKKPCPAGFGKGLEELIGVTHAHLKDALAFTLLIPPHEIGMRRFCLWAIGLAIFTLRNIDRNRDYKEAIDIKISRRTTKAVIFASNNLLHSNAMLKAGFKMATRKLPISRIRPGMLRVPPLDWTSEFITQN